MRRSRLLKYVLLGGLLWTVIVAFSLLFPVILSSRILFGGLVALLFVGGAAMTVLAVREMVQR